MPTYDFTFNFGMKRFSVIDHFILPKCIFDTSVEVINTIQDVDSLSDHDPLFLQIGAHYAVHLSFEIRNASRKLAW